MAVLTVVAMFVRSVYCAPNIVLIVRAKEGLLFVYHDSTAERVCDECDNRALLSTISFKMPKVVLPTLPVSGLFGIAKPSGPPSMTVVNDLQTLIYQSKLFIEASKLERPVKAKGKGRGRHHNKLVKIGQGGTLDPLADGVLGK